MRNAVNKHHREESESIRALLSQNSQESYTKWLKIAALRLPRYPFQSRPYRNPIPTLHRKVPTEKIPTDRFESSWRAGSRRRRRHGTQGLLQQRDLLLFLLFALRLLFVFPLRFIFFCAIASTFFAFTRAVRPLGLFLTFRARGSFLFRCPLLAARTRGRAAVVLLLLFPLSRAQLEVCAAGDGRLGGLDGEGTEETEEERRCWDEWARNGVDCHDVIGFL